MLNHGHVPTAFMKTSIIPILKNRNGDSSDKNNYRPIAIVTAISKLFELCLSKLLDTFLVTSDNQFGFKRKHATDLCIYTVKSVIKYYNYFSSPVYTCFLGASKAFDRVNHWTLFKKLLIKVCQLFWLESCVFGIDVNNCVYNGGKLNPRPLLYRMVYGRAGFYLSNYFLSTWMTYLICEFVMALVVILIMYVSIMCFMQTTYV